jgi:flavin-dependent dehydrogenase
MVIAADGRESRVARALALARYPARPRRWAVGAYFDGVRGMTSMGEMHVRSGHYIGVAPLPGGITNACVVSDDRLRLRDGDALLRAVLAAEPELRDRFAAARMLGRAVMLGPLAVDCEVPGTRGLLLAGDAAGFIDPMTGDGLRFALRGAELAALEGLRALETGASDAHLRLAAARQREFAGKWRFNRALRRLAGSGAAIRTAGLATRVSAWPLSRIIGYAGDVSAA